MKSKKNVIFIVSFLILLQLILWSIIPFEPKAETNNSVDYANLRKYLSTFGHHYVFLTQHTSIFISILGLLYFRYHKNNFFLNIYFCSLSFMVFNLFALTQFKPNSIIINPYGSYQTISVHLIFPIFAFLFLYWIKNNFVIKWKPLIICSFYLTLFYVMLITIYYSYPYQHDNEETHLKIYEFMDFEKKIIIFPTNKLFLKIIINSLLIIVSPFVSLFIFILFKSIYLIRSNHFLELFKKKFF